MAEYQEVEIETQNNKEEAVSSSPDSGINLNFEDSKPSTAINDSAKVVKDTEKSSLSTKQRQIYNQQTCVQNTLYPFFYKYPDNRKLTLLKSLSQDSEYSLDTSLFDAEDFLQEMGFAGSGDPTIPERFLPSLMQRLSKFPESEIEGLNDRIIQSIGCFKRKEGKRRLFRNLSIGKNSNADKSDQSNLSINNSYPLIRSNTGPASFSFNETSLSNENNRTPRIDKLSSSNSYNSSFGDEEYFPQSPIAILVSSASVDVDHDDKMHDSNEENELIVENQVLNTQTLIFTENCSETYNDINDETKENITQNNVEIQYGNTESEDNFENPLPKSNEISKCFENKIERNFETDTEANDPDFTNSENKNVTNSFSFESSDTEELITAIEPLPLNESISVSNSRHYPLRRISQGTNFNLRNSNYIGSLIHQTKIDICDSLIIDSKEIEQTQSTNIPCDNTENHISDYSIESSEIYVSEKEDELSIKEIKGQETLLGTKNEINIPEKLSRDINMEMISKYSQRNKPTYTRDDSLTNFLSSMLDTNDDTLSPNSPLSSQTFDFDCASLKNVDKLSEIPSPKAILRTESPVKKKLESQSNKNGSTINDKSKSLNRQVKERTSNRKRRMLRRMSSSFNYDEEMPVNEPDATNMKNRPPQEYLSNFIPSKLPLRNTFSAPQFPPNCPIIHPCCCFSAINRCSYHTVCEENFHTNCGDVTSSTPYNARNKYFEPMQNSPPSRKIKRNCKRNRYFSCPPSIMRFNCNSCCHSYPLSNSAQNLHSISHHQLQHHTSLSSQSCFNPQQMVSSKDFELGIRTKTNHQGGYLSDPPNSSYCDAMHPPLCDNFFQNNFNFSRFPNEYKSGYNNPSQIRWSSTPDVRNEREILPDCSKRLYAQRKRKINNISFDNQMFGSSPLASSSREIKSQSDVHIPNSNIHFFPHQKLHSKSNSKVHPDKFRVHSSKRNNDFSVEHSNESSYNFPISFSSSTSNESNVVDSPILSQHLNDETICRHNQPLRASMSYPLTQTTESIRTPPQQNRRMSCEEAADLQISNFKEPFNSRGNKREALLEKKIRAFSKFFTNLGNLSKSVSDPTLENNHKSSKESNYHDFVLTDKMTASHFYNKENRKQISKSDKCSTSSPELDKLLKILNAMDLNKTPDKCNQNIHHNLNNVSDVESVSPTYENSILLEMKSDQGCQHLFTPVSYTSSISMRIDDNNNGLFKERSEKEINTPVSDEDQLPLQRNKNSRRLSLQMPFKEVSKELQELQLSIRKAKEMRISASKELHLLQELLSRDTCENHEPVKEKKSSFISCDGNDELNLSQAALEALADLRQKSGNGDSDEAAFWQEEMKNMKRENDAIWRAKLDRMEQRLINQEEELGKVKSENENLQKQLELQISMSSTCHCKTDGLQTAIGRTDSAFEDDEEYMNHKSSIPIQSSRQECERLQEQLLEAEQKADQLNLLLNQKLIELNKLQLTLSKQTKEMIELEKSYLQLQCRLKKGTNKPIVTKLCSRASPFNSKNLCPKPSPPASPHPNGIS